MPNAEMWTLSQDSRHEIGQSGLDTTRPQEQLAAMPVPFTSATAKVASALGHAARWHKPHSDPAAPCPEPYTAKRLARVRAQLDLVDAEIVVCAKLEGQSKRLKELVEAQARLSDQEFALANRPKPANARPQDRKARAPQALPAPEPISQPVNPAPPASS